MEIIRNNIHMDTQRSAACIQFTPGEDMNVPDSRPDVSTILLSDGEVVLSGIRPGSEQVTVEGDLLVRILYHSEENGGCFVPLEVKIPFKETLHMSAVTSSDCVTVETCLEDLSVEIINSRKLSLHSLVTITAEVEDLYDVELPVDVSGEEKPEYRYVPVDVCQMVVSKNDIFRLKEEVSLPGTYPNIEKLLWSEVSLEELDIRPMEEKLMLSGAVHLFALYESEGEKNNITAYETSVPVTGTMDCHGCKEGMTPDIACTIGQKSIMVRPDEDGEERCINMDLVLELSVRIYEDQQVEMITDLYGVENEVCTEYREQPLRKLFKKVTGKTKVSDKLPVKEGPMLQLLYSHGEVLRESQTIGPEGIVLKGFLKVKALYITGDDGKPYGFLEELIPYSYTLEVQGIRETDVCSVRARVEQLQTIPMGGEELEVKAVLTFSTILFRTQPLQILSAATVSKETAGRNELPGMVIYVVKEGDSLWTIGRKYYVHVERIKELNHLETDQLIAGQKLLIVRD